MARRRTSGREQAAALSRMHHRNTIFKLGQQSASGHARIPNELIRDDSLSSDTFRVMALLLSHDSGFQTSAKAISEQMGWGQNTERARNALKELVKAHRLVIKDVMKPGGGRVTQHYVLHADARKFSDAEHATQSRPVLVDGTDPCTDSVGGWAP